MLHYMAINCTFPKYVEYQQAVTVYKSLNELNPHYMNKLFSYTQENHSYGTRNATSSLLTSHSPLWVHIGAGSWSRGFVSQIFLRLIFSETSISQGQMPKKSAYKVF